jgi:hypothetical protein
MDAKIKLGNNSISIIDNCIYVDAFSRALLAYLGLEDKIIGNEACLTESDCRTIISLAVLNF